ncbi:hypothetical protein PATSB16_42150 [Pandoraea thiooxydans]|nr:hypothetical protein PATSB16_42150 [Pandoraea thiooxydans]
MVRRAWRCLDFPEGLSASVFAPSEKSGLRGRFFYRCGTVISGDRVK